jgi:23S rRNA (cytidine1920-2'-O)/16S rRNA (cytidine1409-2'-O)-methyltransferase
MKSKLSKQRLDTLLVEHGLAESLHKAQAMILAGEIRIDGARADKVGTLVSLDKQIEVASRHQKYVSRGGFKLEGALSDFAVDPNGKVCADIGSSTGGFTDCLLQRGAAKVYAIDVNVDQLDWKLQNDQRVHRVKQNARDLVPDTLSEQVDWVVVDVSFISVAKILPAATAIAKPGAEFLILVKPQFELPRQDVAEGGIVCDAALHEKAIARVRDAAIRAGVETLGVKPSHLTGAEGNQEFFLHARHPK